MIPSRPSPSFDHGGVDVAPVMIPHGPIHGQPCLYSYPSHILGHFDRTGSYDETYSNETRLKTVAPFESQIPSKDMECTSSFLPQRRFDTTPRAIFPQKLENESDFPAPRLYDTKPIPSPYCHSNGNHNDYIVDRSRVPVPADSWKDTPQGYVPDRAGSFNRFNGGNFDAKKYMNDIQGDVLNDSIHPVVPQSIFSATSRECQPPYHFIRFPSKMFHKISTENQIPYLNQTTSASKAVKVTGQGASTMIPDRKDVNQALTGSHLNQALISSDIDGLKAIDTVASKLGTVIYENLGESTSIQATNENIDLAKRLREIASEEPYIWGCTCKKSKCLKLYCQCFGSASKCGSMCRCVSCFNNSEYEQLRKSAVRAVLSRNPNAFDKKLGVTTVNSDPEKSATFTCKCRKSACLKKYCECFNADRECQSACRCVDCQNKPPSDEPFKVRPEIFVPQSEVVEKINKNERMKDAVQNLALLKNNSPLQSTESLSRPSLATAVVSKDDDDSIMIANPIPSHCNGGSLQGMDILALAALSELKSLSREDHSAAKMMRTSSTSTCGSSFDDCQGQRVCDSSERTANMYCSSPEHDELPLKKRCFQQISSSNIEHQSTINSAMSLDEKKRKDYTLTVVE